MIINGDCLSELQKLPDKSVDFFYLDLPWAETYVKWDKKIDLDLLWKQLWRLSRHKRVAYVFSCSTKFGYSLIKSWEKGFKMDLVWKKRNKTGGIYSRYRPMKNHEMVYFFYRKAPKYNRNKYHKRIKKSNKKDGAKKKYSRPTQNTSYTYNGKKFVKDDNFITGWREVDGKNFGKNSFEPPNPASVIDIHLDKVNKSGKRLHYSCAKKGVNPSNIERHKYEPSNPVSVIETDKILPNSFKTDNVDYEKKQFGYRNSGFKDGGGARFDPPNPLTIFVSKKVFCGKRHHQTEKPLDLMEFLLKYWTDEGDVVLDATMGSGTMGVMCKQMSRKFIGIEKDPDIFKVAEKRIEEQKVFEEI